MTETPPTPRRWDISTAALIAANAVPIVGVLFLGWHVFPLMLLYWLENVVVGAFNVLRMALADPANPLRWAAKLFFLPFFCVHYGMFCFVHGVFVFALFGGSAYTHEAFNVARLVPLAIRQTRIEFAVLAIVASHAVSFATNYIGGGEYRRASLEQLMQQPYSRVVVLHLAILGSGFALLVLKSPVVGLILLVALKTAIDIRAHRAERRKLAEPGAEPTKTRLLASNS